MKLPSWPKAARFCLAPLGLILALASTVPGAAETLPVVRIGIVFDGPWNLNQQLLDLTQNEILALTTGEFDVRFPEDSMGVGDWSLEGAQREVDRLLADPQVDLIISWGLLASHTACCLSELPKPVIAPVIVDAQLQGLPVSGGTSGITNLNYVALPDNLLNELQAFRRIVPFRKVAFLSNQAFLEAVPDLPLLTRKVVDDLGLDLEFIPVGATAQPALDLISKDVDAVYVWPLGQLGGAEFERLVNGLIDRRLPSFSGIGGEPLQAGLLASSRGEEFFVRLGRRIALNVQRILLGEDPGSIPVAFSARQRLTLNMATARAIDVSPPWDVLLEANLLHEVDEQGLEKLDLGKVVTRAVEANLELEAERRFVTSGAEEIARAWANFLPRLEVSGSQVLIDDDRASPGIQAERTLTTGVTVSQLLYSEPARSNLSIQRSLQASRSAGLEQLRLDTALSAATTYLGVLRAETLLEVRRNNLDLTRSNLELAQIRESIGASSAAEVYRWESQIAADRQDLVRASADLQAAAIGLNRLLHWDLEQRFVTEDLELEDDSLITGEERFRGYTETPKVFRVFRGFSVQEGLARSPELAQLRAAIAAQERTLIAARRAFWAPEVSAQLSVDEVLQRGGAGSDALPGGPDDTSWSLALEATLPIFTGGDRKAQRLQAELDLERQQLLWESAVDLVEEQIRVAFVNARATFSGIGLSRQAAEAGAKNLELVADAYARGAVSILDLLDAQNAALNADLNAANAVYDFFIDLMRAQRASNHFDFFVSPEARGAWFERLDLFFAEAGVERWLQTPAP